MRALSLTPWWARIVASGQKTVENRRWNTKFRGEFLLHASLGAPKDKVATQKWLLTAPGIPEELRERAFALTDADGLARGGIIGITNLVDVVQPACPAGAYATTGADPFWHMPEQYGFVLRDTRALRFIPCKGALGFWQVPAGVQSLVDEQLAILRNQERSVGDRLKLRELGA